MHLQCDSAQHVAGFELSYAPLNIGEIFRVGNIRIVPLAFARVEPGIQ